MILYVIPLKIMAWKTSDFIEMLERAIVNFHHDDFSKSISEFKSHGEVVLSDDGSFEQLCHRDHYALYAYALIENWIASYPGGYDHIAASDWPQFAQSFLNDVDANRTPSQKQWNNIYTLQCPICHAKSRHVSGQIICTECGQEIEFKKPADTKNAG